MNDIPPERERVLVIVEGNDPTASTMTLELFRMGYKIAHDVKGVLCSVVVGLDPDQIAKKFAPFAEKIYMIEHYSTDRFPSELYSVVLAQLCRKITPYLVLGGNTLNALDLLVRLGSKMEVEVITDCVDLRIEPETGHLLCFKPVFGSKVISTFKLERKPYIALLRRKVCKPIDPWNVCAQIIPFKPVLNQSPVQVEVIDHVKEESIDLGKAEVIVGGGRGIRDSKGLEKLVEVVNILRKFFARVELGVTRPLVDARLVPSSRQIGLTGEKVAPDLYIAVGISGSLQHLTGVMGAKKIIAINNDPKAYIFRVADYGILGDFEEVVPAFMRKLEELL